MTRIRRLSTGLAAATLLVVAPGRGADPPATPDRFGERIEVAEALVDVLVTDRRGNVVIGLEPGDFRVTVEGEPAEVTGATFYSNRRYLDAVGGDAAVRAATPDRRWFVVFFDDQRQESFSSPRLLSRQLDAGRETVAWLRDELQPNDYVAVVQFDSRLRLQQDFTNDLDALTAAVERGARGAEAPGDWPSRRELPADVPSLRTALGDPAAVAKETTDVRTALSTLAAALEQVPGRKNLILFTTGFGGFGTTGRYGAYITESRNLEAIDAMNAANTAVYGVDVVPYGTEHVMAQSISQFSLATGGRPFFEVVRFQNALAEIGRQTNGYYLVSVRVSGGGAGNRDVRVSVANPEFRVSARGGFRFDPLPRDAG